jgi:hypothetical protein
MWDDILFFVERLQRTTKKEITEKMKSLCRILILIIFIMGRF